MKVPKEIKGKCQIFKLSKIDIESIVNHLKWIVDKENINVDEKELYEIATNADGSMREALSKLSIFNV